MEKCYKISGRVQGVGYRFWAIKTAAKIGNISGYVSNLPQGDVLVFLAGKEEQINKMLVCLYKGPLFARVDKIEECPEYLSIYPPIENGVFKRI